MLQEIEPKYFAEFRKHIDKRFDVLEDQIDKRFDAHAEQIAEVSEQVSELQSKFGKMKLRMDIMGGDIVILKVDIDDMKGDLKGKADKRDIMIFQRRLSVLEERRA